ncbi:MAG: hypothetical protein PHV24_00930 [Candidatus Kapabacteria bacterium]|nr:hypothetical protein [Candidatus Kapabacteria bacterium]
MEEGQKKKFKAPMVTYIIIDFCGKTNAYQGNNQLGYLEFDLGSI